jgi:hypothetical protein
MKCREVFTLKTSSNLIGVFSKLTKTQITTNIILPLNGRSLLRVFFVVKGPVADATDAPQPYGLLCDPCDEDKEKDF